MTTRQKWDLSDPSVVKTIESNLKKDVTDEFKKIYGKEFSADGLILLWAWSNAGPFKKKTSNQASISLNKTNDDLWFSKWFDEHFEAKDNPFVICFYEFLAFIYESGEFIKIFGYNT